MNNLREQVQTCSRQSNVREEQHQGVVLLRVDPWTTEAVHDELKRLLAEHGEAELARCLVVVEPGRHRVRRAASSP